MKEYPPHKYEKPNFSHSTFRTLYFHNSMPHDHYKLFKRNLGTHMCELPWKK